MTAEQVILADKAHWSDRYESEDRSKALEIDPRHPNFIHENRILTKHLPPDANKTCLEIGCYPGRILSYFHQTFAYQPHGIEYVDWCAEATQQYFAKKSIKATITHADFFEFSAQPDQQYDVVTSFGFIEHFRDTQDVFDRHMALVKPGGHAFISLPNHAGFNGFVLKHANHEKYKVHNLMSWQDLKTAIDANPQAQIVDGGLVGGFGLWNTSVYKTVRAWGKFPYVLFRSPTYVIERLAKHLPATPYFAPNISVLVKKTEA